MNIVEAVTHIMKEYVDDDTLVISSTGVPSRVVYNVKDRDKNFYIMGSLGASVAVGIGLALNTEKNVVVIAGDGDALLGLDNLALMQYLKLPNLTVFILDNGSYCATGGQPTCSGAVVFQNIADNLMVFEIDKENPNLGRVNLTPEQIARRFYEAVNCRSM